MEISLENLYVTWILGLKGLTKYEFTNFAGLHSVS